MEILKALLISFNAGEDEMKSSYVQSSFNPFFILSLSPSSSNSLQQVAVPSLSGVGGMVRPVTGADVGIRRAEIRPGLREIILCKDQDGKVGLRLRSIDNVSQHK